ncbi:hypothetical protein LIER_43338 [Lithospermum erythrorhizon]|uniref:Uncharacterized protein n=1 Tax=Lithospermum erythrorhizon TaxID=34254 RepID=A0AAV3PVW7_LITER
MEEFKSCIDALDETELAGHGLGFTWCSNWASREGSLRKLDHVFYNLEWVQCLPQSYVHVQPPEVSSHCLMSIHLKNGIMTGSKPFKYHRFWEEHPDYANLIRCCWAGPDEDGSHLDGLFGRLKRVKEGLRELNKTSFGDISGRVKQCAEELREVQEQIYNGAVTSELMCKEKNLREVFARYSREMELLRSKARATYLEKGDFSTSFFHRSVVAYTQRHKIPMIEDGDGVYHQDPMKVEGVIVQFYNDLFTSKGSLREEHKAIIRRDVTARVREENWAHSSGIKRK